MAFQKRLIARNPTNNFTRYSPSNVNRGKLLIPSSYNSISSQKQEDFGGSNGKKMTHSNYRLGMGTTSNRRDPSPYEDEAEDNQETSFVSKKTNNVRRQVREEKRIVEEYDETEEQDDEETQKDEEEYSVNVVAKKNPIPPSSKSKTPLSKKTTRPVSTKVVPSHRINKKPIGKKQKKEEVKKEDSEESEEEILKDDHLPYIKQISDIFLEKGGTVKNLQFGWRNLVIWFNDKTYKLNEDYLKTIPECDLNTVEKCRNFIVAYLIKQGNKDLERHFQKNRIFIMNMKKFEKPTVFNQIYNNQQLAVMIGRTAEEVTENLSKNNIEQFDKVPKSMEEFLKVSDLEKWIPVFQENELELKDLEDMKVKDLRLMNLTLGAINKFNRGMDNFKRLKEQEESKKAKETAESLKRLKDLQQIEKLKEEKEDALRKIETLRQAMITLNNKCNLNYKGTTEGSPFFQELVKKEGQSDSEIEFKKEDDEKFRLENVDYEKTHVQVEEIESVPKNGELISEDEILKQSLIKSLGG